MATFHGPKTSLVLQDEAGRDRKGNEIPGVVWARAERDYNETERHRHGVVVILDEAAAARFRGCAAEYGFVEDDAAPVAPPVVVPEPVAPVVPAPEQ